MKHSKVPFYEAIEQHTPEPSYAIEYHIDVSQSNTMEAIAIILENVICMNSHTDTYPNEISVNNINGRLVLSWRPSIKMERCVYLNRRESFERLAKAAAAAIGKANTYGYLRYAEEVASELIIQQYSAHKSFESAAEMIQHFSYAPEIERFIILLYSDICQTI